MVCCFVGHRKINKTAELEKTLYEIVEKMITDNRVDSFLFGSKSEFDELCHKVVTDLKERYDYIKRIYVRAEFLYIDDNYKNYLLQRYDDTYYPEKIINAGKAAYVERNYEMIDKSDFCVVYYDQGYFPQKKKKACTDLTGYQPKSGTKLAYDYVLKNNVKIINVLDKVEKIDI